MYRLARASSIGGERLRRLGSPVRSSTASWRDLPPLARKQSPMHTDIQLEIAALSTIVGRHRLLAPLALRTQV